MHPGIFVPSYTDVALYGSDWRSVQLMNMLLERGADLVYFPDIYKYLFIVDLTTHESATRY